MGALAMGNWNAWLALLIQVLQAIQTLPLEQQEQVAQNLHLGGSVGDFATQLRQDAPNPNDPNAGVGQTT